MKRKSKSLLYQLGVSYFSLLFLIITAFIISLLFFRMQHLKYEEDGKVIIVSEEEVLNGKGQLKRSILDRQGVGSWAELLDEQLRVIDVEGNKLDDLWQYSPESLDEIRSRTGQNFYADVLVFENQDGNLGYCLIKYETDVINFNIQFNTTHQKFELLDERGRSLNGILLTSWGLFVILCAASMLILGLWVNRKVRRPLEAITKGLTQMRKGDYSVRLEFKAIKDFEVIKDSFNQMIDALNQSIKANEAAEQSKRSMLLDLSHDIKTPLTSIRGYASALNDGLIIDEEKKRRYYETILLKTERMSEMVDDLFNLLKLESKAYQLDLVSKDVCEVLRESVVEYYEEIEIRGFDVEVLLPEGRYFIMLDEKLFKRVIGNLIMNALKYNEAGTILTIKVEVLQEVLKIQIADDGIGIPANIREHLFDAFVRGDEARQVAGGTGIGLAIVKAIVEKHGWQIQYKSASKGSVFEITINETISRE